MICQQFPESASVTLSIHRGLLWDSWYPECANKHLCADALFDLLQATFADVKDYCKGNPGISLTDALMFAFATFSLKSPSALSFMKERAEDNLQRPWASSGYHAIPQCVRYSIRLSQSIYSKRSNRLFFNSYVARCLRRWFLSRATTLSRRCKSMTCITLWVSKKGRDRPRILDTALSEIFPRSQAAICVAPCPKYTTSGVRRLSDM